MQLEWRALRRAVESSGSDRAEAIADALAFGANAAAGFPARRTTNGATRFARGCHLTRRRGLGQFARMPTVPQRQHSQEAKRRSPSRKFRGRVRTRLRCAAGRSPAGMAPAGSWHLDLGDCSPQRPTGHRRRICRGSGALRWGNAANGGGGARSGAAGPRRRVASTLR